MGATYIEWATDSLNPGIYGCERVSPACRSCYAMSMAARLERMGRAEYTGTTRGGVWTGEVRVVPAAEAVRRVREYPRARRGRRRIFVTSMADMLHEAVPVEWFGAVVDAMADRGDCDWLVLTKRAHRWPEAAAWRKANKRGAWPRNVWCGVTVEDQRRADERIPYLLRAPAAVRFLSCEPLLGPVDVSIWLYTGWCDEGDPRRGSDCIHWIIAGGESGPHARPSHPAWFRQVRDECAAAGVPFFFKQWGEWGPSPAVLGQVEEVRASDGSYLARLGKRAAGRLLDGVEHDAVPRPA